VPAEALTLTSYRVILPDGRMPSLDDRAIPPVSWGRPAIPAMPRRVGDNGFASVYTRGEVAENGRSRTSPCGIGEGEALWHLGRAVRMVEVEVQMEMCLFAKTEEFEEVQDVAVCRDARTSKSPKPKRMAMGAPEATAVVSLAGLFECWNRVGAFVAEPTDSAFNRAPDSSGESSRSPVMESRCCVGFSLALFAPDAHFSVWWEVLRRPPQPTARTPAALCLSVPVFTATTLVGQRFSSRRGGEGALSLPRVCSCASVDNSEA
jgi:hypothetical protein